LRVRRGSGPEANLVPGQVAREISRLTRICIEGAKRERIVQRSTPSDPNLLATTLTITSWNVESLGEAKSSKPAGAPASKRAGPDDMKSKLIMFLDRAIRGEGSDIVGLMELKGGKGAQVRDWLLAKLNNNKPQGARYTWRASLSSRQDGGTQEEYLYLWKDQPGRLTLDPKANPGPTWSIGVVDENALANFFAGQWTAAQKQALEQQLVAGGVIGPGQFRARGTNVKTATYRVVPGKWSALSTQGASALGSLSGLRPSQLQSLANVLVGIDILRFPTYGDRSPFVASFLVGSSKQPLTVVLFHAPGPGDPTRTDAINIISMSDRLQKAPSLVLMGDFNIALTEGLSRAPVYTRDPSFGPATPRDPQLVFGPITGPPLSAARQLDDQTSLVNAFLPDNSPVAATRSNAYDKFFFHPSANVTVSQNPARVVDLISAIAGNQATPPYNADLARAGLTFFRTLRGSAFVGKEITSRTDVLPTLRSRADAATRTLQKIQQGVKDMPSVLARRGNALLRRQTVAQRRVYAASAKQTAVTKELAALTALNNLVQNAGVPGPTGIGTAHAVYRHGVSDHLPISMVIQAP
jgi:hypothetical protein